MSPRPTPKEQAKENTKKPNEQTNDRPTDRTHSQPNKQTKHKQPNTQPSTTHHHNQQSPQRTKNNHNNQQPTTNNQTTKQPNNQQPITNNQQPSTTTNNHYNQQPTTTSSLQSSTFMWSQVQGEHVSAAGRRRERRLRKFVAWLWSLPRCSTIHPGGQYGIGQEPQNTTPLLFELAYVLLHTEYLTFPCAKNRAQPPRNHASCYLMWYVVLHVALYVVCSLNFNFFPLVHPGHNVVVLSFCLHSLSVSK